MSFQDDEEAGNLARRDEVIDIASFSPTPRKQITMDFYDALKEVAAGKQVTKLEWNSDEYLELKVVSEEDVKSMGGKTLASLVMIYREHDKAFHPYVISDGDLAGYDWVVK